MVKKENKVRFGYNEEQMNEIDAFIRTRKKVFARLLEVPLIKLSTQELLTIKDSVENLYIALEHTAMKDYQICRMSGITQEKLDWFKNNKPKYMKELYTYLELNQEVGQEKSIIFPPEKVREEMKELEEVMYALYKNEMPPEDICEYCRIFVIDNEWKVYMRTFQKRFRDECTKEYRNRMNEKLRYEREKTRQKLKKNEEKELRKLNKKERLKEFLQEDFTEEVSKENIPKNDKNINENFGGTVEESENFSKKTIVVSNGETYTIWR